MRLPCGDGGDGSNGERHYQCCSDYRTSIENCCLVGNHGTNGGNGGNGGDDRSGDGTGAVGQGGLGGTGGVPAMLGYCGSWAVCVENSEGNWEAGDDGINGLIGVAA